MDIVKYLEKSSFYKFLRDWFVCLIAFTVIEFDMQRSHLYAFVAMTASFRIVLALFGLKSFIAP
jgi:hypothetical protein